MSLAEKYKQEIVPRLRDKFGYPNILAVPKVSKVTINVGVGKLAKEPGLVELVEKTLQRITGQAPVKTKAKRSISSFKIRQGMVVGLKVTLRRHRMYDFITKLINITLPRARDFRGLSTEAVDEQGNFNIGFSEHIAFPEVQADDVAKIHGLEVCITTTAKNKTDGLELLRLFGFPFKNKETKTKEKKTKLMK